MSRRRLLAAALLFSAVPSGAEGPLFLELSATGNRVDMGLADFRAEAADQESQAKLVRDVVEFDLAFPGIFNLVEGGPDGDWKASLSAWATLGADLLATGKIERSFGKASFSGSVRDVATGDVVLKKKYALEPGGERAAGHAFADDVIRHFTGQDGVAGSRIVFVNDATGKKELCVVDYDGANFRRITNDRSIALFPKVSPDRQWVAFTTFKEGWPTIQRISLDGARRSSICRYEGLNGAAAWTPDGKGLVATLSLGREPSLHIVDVEGRVQRTLTNAPAADTAPSLSPDGLQVAFTSDRSGRPQIYLMNTSGANLRRLTQVDAWCDSPAWSPQGHLIAFTLSEKGRNFDIYTAEVGTGRLERLTYGEGDNENAAWSPDGKWLAFTSSRRGRPELFVMGADGSRPRPVGEFPGRAFTPNWMP